MRKIFGLFLLSVAIFGTFSSLSASKANAQEPYVNCYAWQTDAGLGEVVRWYAAYIGGLNYDGSPMTSPAFIWNGTDLDPTATSSPFIDMIYTTLGPKTMHVTFSTYVRDSVYPYDIVGIAIGKDCYGPVNIIDKTPTIKVISPNGGETYKVGDVIDIRWTSQYLSTTSGMVSIVLEDTRKTGDVPEHYNYIVPSTLNSGSFSWVIPETSSTQMGGGNVYKILIHGSEGGAGILGDSSDSTFTINRADSKSCYFFATNLQLGSIGGEVEKLQDFLIGNGFKISDLTHSERRDKGYFGGSTYQALVKFQKSVGLDATGYFGPMTRKMINDRCYPQ